MYFVNTGFPLNPNAGAHDFSLVDSMVNLSILQLLFWIQYNKKGELSRKFVRDCIVEVERNFRHNAKLVKHLEENTHMMQIKKYSLCFLDLY